LEPQGQHLGRERNDQYWPEVTRRASAYHLYLERQHNRLGLGPSVHSGRPLLENVIVCDYDLVLRKLG
jgi:hypothetical protein